MPDRRKPPALSGPSSTQGSIEEPTPARRRPALLEAMLDRRRLAAAVVLWVVFAASIVGISSMPGASAVGPVVFSDAFESGSLSQWTNATRMSVQHQPAYAGSWAARATSSGSPSYAYKNLGTPLPELYYDTRFQAISQGPQNVSIVRFRTAANDPVVSIYRLANGKLSYFNPVTGVTATGPLVSTGRWHELEVHMLINKTSSVVEVWLDGTKVISKTTESLGITPVGRFYIGDNTTGHTFDYAFDNEVISTADTTPPDTTPPSTPTGLTVSSSTESSISLAWAASTDAIGVTGYDVFLDDARLDTTPGTAYTFDGLKCGRSYTLGVAALDAAAHSSGRASVTAATKPCPHDTTPPSTPTGLTVRAATQSSITLGWNPSTDNVGVAGYHGFRNNTQAGTTTAPSYTFTGLACGTTYTLGVEAFDAVGNVSGRAGTTAISSPCSGGGGGGGYIKTLDSMNASPVGLSAESDNCTLTRTELGDTFTILPASDRCTWTNQHFSHMHRHEVFEVSERFDLRSDNPGSWENNLVSRPYGNFGNADCSDGGNHELMLWTIRIKSVAGGADHWFLELRGGTSLNLSDQYQDHNYPGPIADGTSVDLGPVVQGQTETFKFDVVSDYQHGAATVWHNGVMVYNNRDRPLGFHYDCNRTTDISNFDLRMQHGVYRGWSGPLKLTSTGFHFLVSEPEN